MEFPIFFRYVSFKIIQSGDVWSDFLCKWMQHTDSSYPELVLCLNETPWTCREVGKSGATSKRSGWIWMVPYLEVTFTTPRIAPSSSWASHCNKSCQHMKGQQKVTQPTAGNLYAHSFTVISKPMSKARVMLPKYSPVWWNIIKYCIICIYLLLYTDRERERGTCIHYVVLQCYITLLYTTLRSINYIH